MTLEIDSFSCSEASALPDLPLQLDDHGLRSGRAPPRPMPGRRA